MKLRLISDGSKEGTKVVTEDGEPIENVGWIQLMWDFEEPELTLSIVGPKVDVLMKEEIMSFNIRDNFSQSDLKAIIEKRKDE